MTLRAIAITSFIVLLAVPAAAQSSGQPLNAIDWLEQAMSAPAAPEQSAVSPQSAAPLPELSEITTQILDAPDLDSTGLFAAQRIGLPRDFWGPTASAELQTAIGAMQLDTMPAALQLSRRLLLAEFASPQITSASDIGGLLQARIDMLIRMGALEEASQLIDAASQRTVGLNARAFDIALLLGEEDRACASMSGQISAAEMATAQVFCLARGGDWQGAQTALKVSTSLGTVSPQDAALLLRFLEEEEADFPLPPPAEMTPLGWRIMEALGDSVTTSGLPVAFAHADLRGTSGWRAQLDAAERLTRAGVFQPNRLLGLYTQRRAAASGGVWERVRAVQRLDAALGVQDAAAAARALETAWPLFSAVELERAFAQMFAERLTEIDWPRDAHRLVWKTLLIAQEEIAQISGFAITDPLGQFVMALAEQRPLPDAQDNDMAAAIASAFDPDSLPAPISAQIEAGAKGLVLLAALEHIAHASAGDSHAAQLGLSILLALGLQADARQIAIELLLLERHG